MIAINHTLQSTEGRKCVYFCISSFDQYRSRKNLTPYKTTHHAYSVWWPIFPKLLSTGGGGGSDYEKFLLDSIFPTKLTEFPTKLTEFVPFIFIISQYCPTVKRILPDWLCLPNKRGGGAAAPSARYAHDSRTI